MKIAATVLPLSCLAAVSAAQEHVHLSNDVYGQVAFLRGLQLTEPARTKLPAVAALASELERSLFPASPAQIHVEFLLEKLDLVPPRLDIRKRAAAVVVKQGFGCYDPERNEIWLHPQRRKKYGDFVDRLLLARLWTQAIDERYFGVSRLRARHGTTLDRSFVIDAVAEGSAAGMMQQWGVEHRKGRKMPELLKMKEWEDARNRASFESPRFFSVHMAKGLMGLHFLTKGRGSAALLPHIPVGISRNTERAYEELPLSSEQILHPEKYWDASRRDVPVELDDEKDLAQRLTKMLGARIVHADTLGELYCGMLAQPVISRVQPEQMRKLVLKPRYWSVPASEGWGGDRLFVVEQDGDRGIAWLTWWDSERDAREFTGAYERFHGPRTAMQVSSEGRFVVFAFGACADRAKDVRDLAVRHAKPRKGRAPFGLGNAPQGTPR